MLTKKEFELLTILSEGVNPYTGEIFDNDHILSQPEVIRTLIKCMKLTQKSIQSLPPNIQDELLYETLRTWRNELAQALQLRAYNILPNKTLAHLANEKPTTYEELLTINGIGEKKAKAYGEDILSIILSHQQKLISV